jgi:hypothetical protein
MTSKEGHISSRRRFTNNLVFRYETLSDVYFCKLIANDEDSRSEIAGYDAIRNYYPVPVRHGLRTTRRGRTLICYNYEMSVGNNTGLLCDLINQTAAPEVIRHYAEQLAGHYREVVMRTHTWRAKTHVRTKLFDDRIKPGGRIDRYYVGACRETYRIGDALLRAPDVRSLEVSVNLADPITVWPDAIYLLRDYFTRQHDCVAAITQGDPTELNIGWPLIWFDFDNAGYNPILGEWAAFSWYIYAMGGYLVPKYAPLLFADHTEVFKHIPDCSPNVRVRRGGKVLELLYDLSVAGARKTLLTSYRDTFITPVAAQCGLRDWEQQIRYYIALRIIGVYDIWGLDGTDTAFLLAKLGECMSDGRFRFNDFFGLEDRA